MNTRHACMYLLFSQGNSRFLSSCYAPLGTRCIFQDVKFRSVVVWIFPFPKQNQQSGLLFSVQERTLFQHAFFYVQKLLHILKRNYSQKSGISRLCISTGCLEHFKHMSMFKKEVFESLTNGEKDSPGMSGKPHLVLSIRSSLLCSVKLQILPRKHENFRIWPFFGLWVRFRFAVFTSAYYRRFGRYFGE